MRLEFGELTVSAIMIDLLLESVELFESSEESSSSCKS